MTTRLGIFLLLVSLLAAPASAAQKSGKTAASPRPAEASVCSAAPYHQFDFWLGDWDVFDAAGKPAGHDHVVSILDSCAIEEDWESEKGGRGRSLNVYDAVAGRWHQTFVDDRGGLLELNGGLEEGNMVLIGAHPSVVQKGARVVHRISWTPVSAGKIHQLWEISKNEGRTWATVFDGMYVRKK